MMENADQQIQIIKFVSEARSVHVAVQKDGVALVVIIVQLDVSPIMAPVVVRM